MRVPLLPLAAAAALALAGCAVPTASSAPATPGMVSAADPRAAAAGVEMLRRGGSSTDAAIATMLALTVVEPQSSGIGGGGFYVHSDAAGHVDTINGREKAPAAATPDWFLVNGQPRAFADAQAGGLSTGVPGNVLLAARAHAEHGKLAWAALFEPAIRLAEIGFAITPRLHNALASASATGAFGDGAKLFYDSTGAPLPVGTTIRNPALGAFLRRLAAEGPSAFYQGANAAAIAGAVATAKHNPAPMTLADITSMTAPAQPPVCGQYRDYRICGMGPPTSGGTTVFAILKQLERFNLTALGKDSPTAWHLIAESERLAYADRDKYLADATFVNVPVKGLMDPAYLASRSALIDPTRALPQAVAGAPPGAIAMRFAPAAQQPEHGTSHFVAVDRSGDAVSYTSTIESSFGSGIVVNGYYLNNELTDFSFVPTKDGAPVANRVEGSKRPRSSMAPTIVYGRDGHIRLIVGAAGGSTIPAQVAKVILGVLDFRLTAQQAIALPMIVSPGDTLYVERGTFLEAMIPQLKALGHSDIRTQPPATYKANAIEWAGGRWVGAADPRSEGVALSE